MQDAGDSPPDRQRSEGRKRRNFSAPRRIRPKPGTASDRRTPRSRCGVSEQRLTQRFAPRNRRRGLLWWIVCCGGLRRWNYVAGLKIGTARNRYKKRPRKNRGHTVELNFRAGVSAATHIGRTKRSSFFHRLQGPEFRLSRRRVRGTVCTANSRLFFRPRARSGPPDSAPAFVSVPGDCPSVLGFPPGSDLLIRSPPGPGIIRRAAPARARRHQRHRLPESRPAAWQRAPRTRSRAPATSRRPS